MQMKIENIFSSLEGSLSSTHIVACIGSLFYFFAVSCSILEYATVQLSVRLLKYIKIGSVFYSYE